jgi:hypothetical protein
MDRLDLEIFYKLADNRRVIFGLQYHKSFKHAIKPQIFIDVLAQLLPRVMKLPFNKGAQLLGLGLNGDPDTFFQKPPEEIAVGIVNHWFSVGPCKVWEAGEPTLTKETLAKKLKNHKLLKKNTLNFINLEHYFTAPTIHWLGVEVSYPCKNGDYSIDEQFALQIAQMTFCGK